MSFTIKSVNNIVADILFNITQNVPDVNDLNPGSIMRQMVESVSTELELLYTDLQNVYDGTRIDTAASTDLDSLGALVGVTRKVGTMSTGFVSFIRAQAALSDFSIPVGSVISTQPNTGEEQLRFTVNANTTFLAEITDESHTYKNGTVLYKAGERFISGITQLKGTASALPYIFTEGVDYQIVKNTEELIVDVTTIDVVDDCEAVTGWSNSTNASAIATDTVNFVEGIKSLKLGKSGVSDNLATYTKTLGSVVDATNNQFVFAFRILNKSTMDKIQYLGVTIGSGGSATNSYYIQIPYERLAIGWNNYLFNLNDSTVTVAGSPNRAALDFFKISIVTNLATDTIANTNLNMDYLIFAETQNFIGDLVEFLPTGTVPDTATTWTMTYAPLSKEVACTSEAVGIKYNVGTLKIMYKVSIVANVDSIGNYAQLTGGTDIEIDDDFRARIQLATQVQAKATTTALRQAVLAISGIVSVGVEDMPLTGAAGEPHIYNVLVTDYKIDFEIALDNGNLKVSNTVGGAANYSNGTDYVLEDNQIKWLPLGSKPTGGATFYVSYDYNWLGHVQMFVAGTSTPLSPALAAEVLAVIVDTKAAGIYVTYSEPTVVYVDVTVSILADTLNGFTFAGMQPIVVATIQEFLNAKNVGDDIYIADIISTCQGVTGVKNTTVTLPATDITISTAQVARAGTIIVGSL